MLPMYNRQTFSDIFPDLDSFKDCLLNDFDGYAASSISNDEKKTLYWLLYARYGNNPITNNSVAQFKAKMVAIVFAKGPTWAKKVELQKSLRLLNDDDLRAGAVSIYNTALNPETAPSTQDTDELEYVNSQNVSKHKRSFLDAYSFLQDLLKNDVTEEFIKSFAILFSRFVGPMRVRIYENDLPEEEEDDDQ